MTEFSVYLDDGGHPDDQPYLVVAGYVATEAQWLAFEPRWKETLAKYSLDYPFHMTDFMYNKRYSALRRDQILCDLAAIVKAYTSHPFVSALDVKAYKRINDEFALEECHGAPYALACRSLVRAFRIWTKANLQPDDHMLTFIEEGTKHYGDLEQVFKRDRLPIPHRVPKTTAQVQPADILAWELFNWLRAGRPKKPSKNLDRLTHYIRTKQSLGGIVLEHDMRRICKDTKAPLRSTLKPGDTIAFHSERKRKRKRTIK
jgi:hypothetical protein